jgi:hypothetical protein
MGMPCGVFVLPCFLGYALWCLTPQGIPMKAREYENTTRHTHESKEVRNHQA